jgi:hypothetical protein
MYYIMSSKDNKYGKKKMFKNFNREKNYIYCEEDIIVADKNQNLYKEGRNNERNLRKTTTELDTEQNDKPYDVDVDTTVENHKMKQDDIIDDDNLSD